MENQMIENPFVFEDKYDPLVPTATMQIYQWLAKSMSEPSAYVNRASSAPWCTKRRQYAKMKANGKPLTPRKRINFWLGDLSEMILKYMISKACVGEGKIYERIDFGKKTGSVRLGEIEFEIFSQNLLTANIGGIEVTGHADGFGLRNVDKQWELIEIKSAANRGFSEFKSGGEIDYIKQVHALMATREAQLLNVTSGRFYYLRKETGNIWDRFFQFDQKVYDEIVKEYQDVENNAVVEPPYKLKPEMTGRAPNKVPTGRMIASFPCDYCPYLELCHGPHTMEWKSGQFGVQKPAYIFDVTNSPNGQKG